MNTVLNLLLASILCLTAGCELYPTEYNLDGKKPKKPDVVTPDKPVKPDKPATPVTPVHPVTPLPANLPDQDVIKAISDVFATSADPRAKFDVIDYAGVFLALSEILAEDKQVTKPAQVLDVIKATRSGVGLEQGRYPGFTKVIGPYLERKMPTVIDEKGRATVVEALQVISAGCQAGSDRLNGKAVKAETPTLAPELTPIEPKETCDPPVGPLEPRSDAQTAGVLPIGNKQACYLSKSWLLAT